MKYRVLWSPQAEERLESLLKTADDPQALVDAGREVDRLLLNDPNAFGESRYDTVRVGFAHPLGILFEVMDDVRTVIVFDLWRIDRK
ncbi:MAG: hypothetical protein WD851_24240 [Pirellulales bacterium]